MIGVIKGPDPYYSGGNFKIDVVFTNDYPFKVSNPRRQAVSCSELICVTFWYETMCIGSYCAYHEASLAYRPSLLTLPIVVSYRSPS